MRMPHSLAGSPDGPSDLVGAIHQVRRRWRYKLMLRGAVGVLGLGALALIASAWGLESWRFTPGSIVTFRILLALAIASLIGWFIVRPLLWRVTDEQVAMYLEEHEPSLQAEIISAIEASRLAQSDGSPHSQRLVARLVESAVRKVEAIDWGRNVERSPMRRYATTFAVIAIAAVALFSLGPRFLRHGLSALLVVSRSVQAAAPYRIDVTPGNASVPRGVDQTITATLAGFEASEASLMMRKSPDAPFERVPLVRSENSAEGEQVRRHAVRSGRADRLLRRGRGREVGDVHAEGRRSALRPEARARVSLPRVHRARAAQDRGRRRHRRAQGHRGPRQGDADDDRARRTDRPAGRSEGAR